MLDQNFLNQIKKQLKQEQKRLEQELSEFSEKDIHRQDGYHAKFPDFGDESDENAREVAAFGDYLTLEKTLESELRDIKDTLKRIKAGTYGVCKYCGQPISRERLLARSTSSTCIQCKKKLKGEA